MLLYRRETLTVLSKSQDDELLGKGFDLIGQCDEDGNVIGPAVIVEKAEVEVRKPGRPRKE